MGATIMVDKDAGLRVELNASEATAGVQSDRPRALVDAPTDLRAVLDAREAAAAIRHHHILDLADASADFGTGLNERELAARVLSERTRELDDANTELRAGLDAREKAARILTKRTKDLEVMQARSSVMAEFSSTLNQEGMLDVYRGALGCLSRAIRVPFAVIYGASMGDIPIPQCAFGPDHRPMGAAPFAGDGLPATVVRTSEVQVLFGPFDAADLRIHFGLGVIGLQSIIGWPIIYMGRCIGALVTAHTIDPTEDQRTFVVTSLAQLAIRMNGFQVEQQRLQLVSDLQARSNDLLAQTTALEEARQEAERASRAKSEFLANMSHELRTPMNSIMGFTQRLITKLGDSLPEREMKALLTVDRNAKHLLVLINDILDLAKIEAGKMDLSRSHLNLVAIVQEAVEQAAPLTDNKPVQVRFDPPPAPLMFIGDRVRLKQVVLNLLSNAIRYTNEGTVTISVCEANDATLGRVVQIAVRDTGIGIKPEDLSRLFQQFTQLNSSSTRKIGGTGLGLAISAHYARMHGGRIDVKSEFGQGAEFAVILPVLPTSRAGAPRPTATTRARRTSLKNERTEGRPMPASADSFESPPPSDGIRILCVDDEPDILTFLQLTFEDAGYYVLLASDHDAAIEEAKARIPDVICLDLNMPGKDGFEVLRTLRTDTGLRQIPVIIVSVNNEEVACLNGGALRYLAKPVRAIDLLEAVQEVLAGDVGNVLIVDDNPDAVRLYAELLGEKGLEVRIAANGLEALDHLRQSIPSVIVLDLMMPVMDGFTFLEIVQRNPIWAQVPVIIFSAMTLTPEEVVRLERSSAAILIKGRDTTTRVVQSILKLAHSKPDLRVGMAR
jgi:signal transduction histidine kinase/DNA-binding response OmpR family regulator